MIRVLLVDDHAVVREGLRALLASQPDIAVVGGATTGREAVSQVQELRPDVVVMDIGMQDMNGIDATYEIRDEYPACQVVILSVHSTAEYVFRALRAGARGSLLKASAGKEIAEAIRTVHGRGRYLCREITETVVDEYLQQHEERAKKSPVERLSPRELSIVQLVVEGKSSAEIAAILTISPKTVETHRHRAMQKLCISDLPTLVKFAIQHGLTSLE